jgi:hypothetical protein
MRRYTKLFAIVSVVSLTGLGVQPDGAHSQSPEQKPGTSVPSTSGEHAFASNRILVKTKEGVSTEAVEPVNRKNKAHTKTKIPRTRLSVVELPKDLPVQEAVKRYETSPDVEYAEPDYKVYPAQGPPVNDTDYSKLYGLDNTGQNSGPQTQISTHRRHGVSPLGARTPL